MTISFADWSGITDIKAKYCRYLDTKQWDAWRELFVEDYVLEMVTDTGTSLVEGRDEAIASTKGFIQHLVTVHQVHMPEIVVDGDTAIGIWPMQDRVILGPDRSISGFGHYHDEFRRVDGLWKIARLKLVRLHLDWLPGSAPVATAG
jgi:hypothetical protein